MRKRQLIRMRDNLSTDYSDWHCSDKKLRKALLELIAVEDPKMRYVLLQTRFNILPYDIRNNLQTKIRILTDD